MNVHPLYANGLCMLSVHVLSTVQQHAPCHPSIDKLSCSRRLHHDIDFPCVFYKDLSALYCCDYDKLLIAWVKSSTATSSSWSISQLMYIQCMHLVYACLRFVLYSVHIECMLRMRLLISVTTLTSNYHAIEDCTSIYHVCCTRSMHAATMRYCIIWGPSWRPMQYCIVRGPSTWGPSVSISIDIVTARTSYAIGLKHNMCLFRDDVIHALMCSLASQASRSSPVTSYTVLTPHLVHRQ